ncbi:methyl-accepting chemotaxis protein [Ferviditalea candida]|uniref:Methyl-accepting chemotaxis protein n=1 Tax=Ferviditalea candida TaxID=3108399 RepID=A0ABU5ZGL8_9BACL|nr:methyl-accepting chemotaxis protein [Paenibacillaceae bacterium T2]
MKIKMKLLLGYLGVILIFTIGLMVMFMQLKGIEGNIGEMDRRSERSSDVSEVFSIHRQKIIELMEYIIHPDPGFIKKFQEQIAEQEKLLTKIEPKMKTDEQKKSYATIVNANQVLNDAFLKQIVPAVQNGNLNGAKQINDTVIRDQRSVILDAVGKLVNSVNDEFNTAKQEANSRAALSITILFAIIIVSIGASLGIAMFMGAQITGPIRRVQETSERIAKGDLSGEKVKVTSKDEVGALTQAMNTMAENMKGLIGSVAMNANQVAAASQQISASTEEIAGGSTNQAAAAQTMTELFKELSIAINTVAVSAEEAANLSNQAVNIAQEGGQVVHQSINGMKAVNEQISKLEEDSNKIGDIIEVIDDIAEQTNLLALNAAIEAARAGEQGRGFAVVADEVRKLAERAGEATKQITQIIKGMQNNTAHSVKAVVDGLAQSEKTGNAFEKIIAMVNSTSFKVNEIAAASEEQAAQSAEVMNTIETIAAASEESAAAAEETASTSQALAQLADELNQSVSVFKIK